MKAVIHFSRIGKGESLYVEELIRDDGVRLDTRSVLPPEARDVWRKSAWQKLGILADGPVVREVRKHHFYHEWFDIIELLDDQGGLLGYYCDVITPLRKVDGEYYLLDLLLDLWIFPDHRTIELDWDEFQEAARLQRITPEQQQKAVETLAWMVTEAQHGIFPERYLP
jgi:predicted RNA-binding protein associated with RNAse of E/G family